MILIADCSALIALSACKSLYLLDALFGTVLVPETVYHEATGSDKPEADELANYLDGKIRTVDNSTFVFLDAFADAGETDAMLLYKQLGADRLLIDDKRGRKVAKINHINIIGSLGVLIGAKRMGLIPAIRPLIRQIEKSRVFMSPAVIAAALELAEE
jgi:predicted nucleic acid-binding protein